MVDTKLTDLTEIDSGDITNISSVFLYVTQAGNSRKVRPDILFPFKGALVNKVDSQALSQSVETPLTWEEAQYDYGGFFSGSGSTVLTVTSGSPIVQLWASIDWASVEAGIVTLGFFQNSMSAYGLPNDYTHPAGTSSNIQSITSAPIQANSGDFFEVVAQHTDTGNDVIEPSTRTWFAIRILW